MSSIYILIQKQNDPPEVRQAVDILYNIAVLSHLQAVAGSICHHQLFNVSLIFIFLQDTKKRNISIMHNKNCFLLAFIIPVVTRNVLIILQLQPYQISATENEPGCSLLYLHLYSRRIPSHHCLRGIQGHIIHRYYFVHT